MTEIERCRKPLLPQGRHEVELERIDIVPSARFAGQMSREFVFSNDVGEISRKTAITLRQGTDLHLFAEVLFGNPINSGDTVDLGLLVGRRFEILVSDAPYRPRLIESVKPIAN
jgi:hypothetical protein